MPDEQAFCDGCDDDLLRESLVALQDLTPTAKRYFIEYTPTAGEDFGNGALIRKANLVIARLEERLLNEKDEGSQCLR